MGISYIRHDEPRKYNHGNNRETSVKRSPLARPTDRLIQVKLNTGEDNENNSMEGW